jgi:hypothetical protein
MDIKGCPLVEHEAAVTGGATGDAVVVIVAGDLTIKPAGMRTSLIPKARKPTITITLGERRSGRRTLWA